MDRDADPERSDGVAAFDAESEPERIGADEAFNLVASEARFDILRALWELQNEERDDPSADESAVSFSTLHDATDVRDSGQFNYHLDKLVPRFVRQTDDGYDLTYAGTQVVGAAVSGIYTDSDVTAVDPIEVGTCPECGGAFEAKYERGHIDVGCESCDVSVTHLPAPPVLAATTADADLPQVFSQRILTDIHEVNRGFCQLCGGSLDADLDRSFSDEIDTWAPRLGARFTCRACGITVSTVLGATVIDHPAVVGFLYDHGIDLRETYLWDLDWLFEAHGSVTSEEPLRVAVRVEVEGDTIELTLDEDLAVVDVDSG